MASPLSPRLVQKAAVDALQCDLLDTFRGKEEPSDGGEPQWPVAASLVMKKEADAPADVVDMSNWQKVDEYAREQLNLERDATKMKVLLRVQVKLSNIQNPIRIPIRTARPACTSFGVSSTASLRDAYEPCRGASHRLDRDDGGAENNRSHCEGVEAAQGQTHTRCRRRPRETEHTCMHVRYMIICICNVVTDAKMLWG